MSIWVVSSLGLSRIVPYKHSSACLLVNIYICISVGYILRVELLGHRYVAQIW